MIEGVVVKDLKQFVDDRGRVMHMVRADDPLFEKFGEIYEGMGTFLYFFTFC